MTETANLIIEYQKQSNDGRVILAEFAKPLFSNIFYKNKKFLLDNSSKVDFNNNRWTQNPHQFCLDTYETQQIFPIILLCNDLKSLFEFNYDQMKGIIKTPTLSSIISVLTYSRI